MTEGRSAGPTVEQFLKSEEAYEVDQVRQRIGEEAIRVLLAFMTSMERIIGFQRITINALEEYRLRGNMSPEPALNNLPLDDQLAKHVELVVRMSEVDFLKRESADAEPHVVGQSVISMWSALEVFVEDLLLAVLMRDRSLFKNVNEKHRVTIAGFYSLEDEERIANVIRLVKSDSELSPGLGMFEPVFKAFELGGSGVANTTKRVILELVAVRNCLAHRQGIVDKRFLEACRTTELKLGETIRLTQEDASRYFYAASQYASTVTDRVWAKYTRWAPSPMTARMLQSLEEAVEKRRGS